MKIKLVYSWIIFGHFPRNISQIHHHLMTDNFRIPDQFLLVDQGIKLPSGLNTKFLPLTLAYEVPHEYQECSLQNYGQDRTRPHSHQWSISLFLIILQLPSWLDQLYQLLLRLTKQPLCVSKQPSVLTIHP